ncbi:class I SAM-dependent methyltransferase [Altererythrobacter lutimaris]|uniref:Methyltransferase domain-containing protein n=1 Tax=Altererythrobacter lutimaris TaxID=2743979 RepID=A0A850HE38_9SPHN|nr:methyltransferase domain-containing protein [Altererythrobacter lutimaris]NVE95078.1 methyltransferase domain-containing protein [Altererythrobacter lutimaris]
MPLVPEFLAGRTPPDLYGQYLEPAFEPWVEALLDYAGPHGRVIDIACGTGIVSRFLARLDQVEQIDAIDVAPAMIAKARSMSSNSSPKISFIEASALSLPFADDTFDAALCQQGLQFFPDKLAGLREARRVLKPGARAAFSIWCNARDGLPVFDAFERAISDALGSDLVPFGPFSFGDRDEISSLAEAAGFKSTSIEVQSRLSPLPDIRTFVLFDIAFLGRPAPDGTLQPIMDFANPASDDVILALIDRMEKDCAAYCEPDGSLLAPMRAHILIAEA